MDLKEMILNIVYLSPEGLSPIKIVEALASQYSVQTTTQQVLHIIEKHPKLFHDDEGKIMCPPAYSFKKSD